MRVFAANLVLGLLWLALTGTFSPSSFLFGFLLAYLLLWVVIPGATYFRKAPSSVRFLGFFVKELVVSALQVAHDAVTPRHHMRPSILAVPLDVETDLEITLLANLVTLTPGSLAVEVSADRKVLYVHAMYAHDPDRARRHIKEGFERRVLDLVR